MTITAQNGRRSLATRTATALLPLFLLAGCSDGSDNFDGLEGGGSEPFAELIANGIARYLGIYTPMMSETGDDGVVTHTFGTGDGPLCLDGTEYRMGTFDAGSDNLVIFLQGGGACWSTFCQASTSAEAGIPQAGILDPNYEDNPVKDWNQVYLPYCDGGLHASDKDNDYDGDGNAESPQRGLHNLSAALDVAVNAFPSPSRILLTGASGGGYGTTFALPLVRHLYPDAEIEVVNDSGVGIGKPDDPSFLELLLGDWNQGHFLPADCSGLPCLGDDGHLTNYLVWQLDEDPSIRRSMLSSKQDVVIGTVFLQIGGPAHEAELLPELAQMEEAHPDRFRSWVVDGNDHTYIQRAPEQEAGGVRAIDFIANQLGLGGDWVSVSD